MKKSKYDTDEERSRAWTDNARQSTIKRVANGNNRGGRPIGSNNRTRSAIRRPDVEVFYREANARRMTFADLMHEIALTSGERVPEESMAVFRRVMESKGCDFATLMKAISDSLVAKNPEIFRN